MERFSFGNTSEMADELLGLVLEGKKTATSWAAVWGDEGDYVGNQQIIVDSEGNDRALIETTSLVKRTFMEVDEEYAKAEGEGDLSLDFWRKEHKRFFSQEKTFSQDMEIFCRRFKVIKVF
jgi:uncharacterized protein YhfF